jgi:predicted nucleotidyltransferase
LAKKAWTNFSDIDLAVRGIPGDLFFRAFAEASSLSIPWTLDLIDMDDCFAEIIEEIEREGVSI